LIALVILVGGIAVITRSHRSTDSNAQNSAAKGPHDQAAETLRASVGADRDSSVIAADRQLLDLDEKDERQNRARQMLAAMPVVFEENRGQWDTSASLIGSGHGLLAGFEAGGIMLGLTACDADGATHALGVHLQFGDSNPCMPRGERKLAGARNYLRGNDPTNWKTNVSLFEEVRYDDLYPGVSVVVGDRQGMLEYDLELADASRLEQVRIDCEGVESIDIAESGDLRMHTELGTLCQSLPASWYVETDGTRKPTECRFRVLGANSYGFELETPKSGGRLVVDPGLTWSTFLGGAAEDRVRGIDLQSGLVTVVGSTNSVAFPTTTGAVQTVKAAGTDAFVSRFNPLLTGAAQLVWSTFLGGFGEDDARAVAVQSNGIVAFCGATTSSNFPTTVNGVLLSAPGPGGQKNAFVSRLDSTGSNLLYSTYFGGNSGFYATHPTVANAIVLDANGLMTFVGNTSATDLPLVNAYDSNFVNPSVNTSDGFVAQVFPNYVGTASLIYSTYIGGTATGYDEPFAVDVESGLIYVGGSTEAPDFGVTLGTAFQPTYHGPTSVLDGFIMIIDPTKVPATQLQYATYLGSAAGDQIFSLVAKLGVIYCCGITGAGFGTGHFGTVNDFPTSVVVAPGIYVGGEADGLQTTSGGSPDAFVVKLDPSNALQQLRYGTLFGGNGFDQSNALARVSGMSVVVVGSTTLVGGANTLPTTSLAYQPTAAGGVDAFLTRLDWSGGATGPAQILYSTFLGGSADDFATCLALDASRAYIGGNTLSTNFPTAGNPFDSSFNGGTSLGDGFACTLEMNFVH